MERTVIELKKARRRRVGVWTPWGCLPIDKSRSGGGPRRNDDNADRRPDKTNGVRRPLAS